MFNLIVSGNNGDNRKRQRQALYVVIEDSLHCVYLFWVIIIIYTDSDNKLHDLLCCLRTPH